MRERGQPRVAGQQQIGETVLEIPADSSLERAKGIRTQPVNPAHRGQAPPVQGRTRLACIVTTESGTSPRSESGSTLRDSTFNISTP
jgi:hypothetical protein